MGWLSTRAAISSRTPGRCLATSSSTSAVAAARIAPDSSCSTAPK
ncbi:MAG TPA: hypothetical protein VHW44_30370 [Pseudonocardiaceae bacterium]|nr:hypothetical protein [Pseudonocardiaceae bacterium]